MNTTSNSPRRSAVKAQPAAALPNRAGIATEQRNLRSRRLHEASVAQCVSLINREDAAVITALKKAGPALTKFIEAVEPRFCDGDSPGRLIYLGAGTSGRLGVLDASEAPPTFQISPDRIIGIIAGGDSALRKSSEGKEDDPDGAREELARLKLTNKDTVVGIAAGGTTPYVLGALRIAKRTSPRCLTAMISCSPIPVPPHCDHLIVLNCGPEVLTGSTRMKAGTATKLALNTISTTLMVRSGRVHENLMVDLRASNAKLRDRAARIISTLTNLDRDASLSLLDAAEGHVKAAVVMHKARCDLARARELLSDPRSSGRLDRAVAIASSMRSTGKHASVSAMASPKSRAEKQAGARSRRTKGRA
ncbi:MAG: N-acetylmuramic acid 6-phosphate etherase [Phycisphaerales bacterium]|nr:N-acetylmuramic acid 6-phosphate etherase [Phycisphaerales bacterium]